MSMEKLKGKCYGKKWHRKMQWGKYAMGKTLIEEISDLDKSQRGKYEIEKGDWIIDIGKRSLDNNHCENCWRNIAGKMLLKISERRKCHKEKSLDKIEREKVIG